jgi:WhiB family redox-sensing transcriptional regulator
MADPGQAWQPQAACRGAAPALFFAAPDDPHGGELEPAAKALCARCPVKRPCLVAGAREPWGIWGGLTARERRLVGKEHGGAAA